MEKLNQEDLKRMFIFASQKIEEEKEEINKINVFPVPDQDTGTNLAKTLLGIKESLEKKNFENIETLSQTLLDSALVSARGNSGVIFTGFLIGFFSVFDKNPIDALKLTFAFEEGKKRAWKSMLQPKEGTILDVIDAVAETFQKESEREKDIIKIFEKSIKKAKEALLLTREKMEILKKANVVDAGGLGFLIIMESFLESLAPKKKKEKEEEKESEKLKRFIQVLANRYEIVALIFNPTVEEKEIKEKLKTLGDCLDIVSVGEKTKIHIHTDYPEEVREAIKEIGKIENLRIEDMAKEIAKEPSIRKVSLGIITEDTNFLLPKIIERYQIEIVPTFFGKKEEKENYSQEYKQAIKKKLGNFEKVLFLSSSSKISKSFSLGLLAKENFGEKEKKRIFIFDTKNIFSGQALFVLKTIELIQEQRETEDILKKLQELWKKTQLYCFLRKPNKKQFFGKLSNFHLGWLKRKEEINVYPLITLSGGKIKNSGIFFAKDEADALFKKIKKAIKKKKIRAVIHHYQNFEAAKKLEQLLKSLKGEVSFISEIISKKNFIGPGSLMCAFQEL